MERVCNEPGCPWLATYRGKCPRHQTQTKRLSPHARGYDARWRRTARAYIKAHPTCEWVACTEPASCVDHVDGLGPLGPRGHDARNLRALCHSHHSKRTARDQPGGWNTPAHARRR